MRRRMTRCSTWSVGILLFLAASARAAEWGDLELRFVYDGKVPEAPKLELNKDVDVCGPFNLRDESLVVDAKTKGIANVVVWLDVAKSGREPDVHPSFAKEADEPAVLANTKCRFEPHVMAMRSGRTLEITNDDPVAHATAFFFLKNDPINVTLPAKAAEKYTIAKAEKYAVQITCPIHAWMKGYLFVTDHPYIAISGQDGSITMKNLPAGEWTFRVWHERAGFLDEVTIDGTPTEWKSGRFTIDVPAGKPNDLGDVAIAAKAFEE